MRTTIEMAREAAGDDWKLFQEFMPEIHRLAELVRADERSRMATDKSKEDEAIKLTMEALEQAHDESLDENHFECRQILMGQITALREALAEQPAPVKEPATSAAKGAIMGAAYDFRDAHLSGSTNLKRSAHAELESAVDAALAEQPAPVKHERCRLCDCTGDIHSADGEWRGECKQCKQPAPAQHERVRELECVIADLKAECQALRAEQPAQQEPVALKWQKAPVKTQWGDEMVVASVAIDKDHTLSLYCERDQTPKVEAMFALAEQPAQQEPVARQYQNRDGVWKDFISEKHYKDTLEDGSWPIRNLYTSPPAQRTWAGLEKSDMPDGADPLFDDPKFIAGMVYAANKLMEKNT